MPPKLLTLVAKESTITSVKFYSAVSTVLAGICLGIGAPAEQSRTGPCHGCGEGTRARKTDPSDARLVSGCTATARLGSLTADEAERYCRWVVRVRKSEPGDTVVALPSSSEMAQIEAALTPLQPVQPVQIKADLASVLVTDPNGAPGNFTVVWLRKDHQVWTIHRAAEAAVVQRKIGR